VTVIFNVPMNNALASMSARSGSGRAMGLAMSRNGQGGTTCGRRTLAAAALLMAAGLANGIIAPWLQRWIDRRRRNELKSESPEDREAIVLAVCTFVLLSRNGSSVLFSCS
jgi:hypothetical protein